MFFVMQKRAYDLRSSDLSSDVFSSDLPARGAALHMVSGEIAVRVRLDVSPWQGRSGRIYMLLPEQPAGAITATWTTRGRLLPGVLRAGERALVYAGPIAGGGLLGDTLDRKSTRLHSSH